jgi:hypothetical protein
MLDSEILSLTHQTIDTALAEFADTSGFYYTDFEEKTAKLRVYLENLRVLLVLGSEQNTEVLRRSCLHWMSVMTNDVPKGWNAERLEQIRTSPAWLTAQKAIDGEIPFSYLVRPPVLELEITDE